MPDATLFEMQVSDFIPSPLRILHLEDNPRDAELIRERLAKDNLPAEITHVENRADFSKAFEQGSFDMILADCTLNNFDGFEALRFVRQRAPDLPFIFVTGTFNEASATRSIQVGATDYVLKDDLARLGFAVRRALHDIDQQKDRAHAAHELIRNRQELADFFEKAPVGLHWTGPDGRILKANRAELELLGYSDAEYLGRLESEFHEDPTLPRVVLARLESGERVPEYEARLRCKNGAIKTVLIETNALWENAGLISARSFTRDISARKRAENRLAALSKLGQRLNSVTTPGEAAEIIADTADALLSWDACSIDLYLTEQKQLSSIFMADLVDGKRARVPPVYANPGPSPLINRVLHEGAKLILRDGATALSPELVPFGNATRPSASLMFVPIRNGANAIGVLSIQSYKFQAYSAEDLNTLQALADHCGGALERIRAQQASSGLAAIVESSSEAIVGRDLDGIITSWNAGAEKIFGYPALEAVGKSGSILVPPDRTEEESHILDLVKRGEKATRFETVRVCKDGRLIDVSMTVSPITDTTGQATGASIIADDITERKQVEIAIEKTEDLYRRAISGVGAVPYLYDFQTDSYSFMGGGNVRLTGYTPEEMRPELWRNIARHSIMLGDSAGLTREEAMQRVLADEVRYWRCDSLISTKKGELRWISDTSVQDRDESGKPIGSIGILQDITDRKESERALRESEERFRRVVESDLLGIIFWESTGRIVFANDKFLAMAGYTREDLKTGLLDWGKLTPPEYLQLDEKGMEQLRLHGFCPPFEKEFFRKDGSRVPILIGSTTLPGMLEKGVSFVLDITERRRAETRMTALSQLGKNLSAAATPMDAGKGIAETAERLFGWDSFTLDLYSADEDKTKPVMIVDTIDGKKVDIPAPRPSRDPTTSSRRVLALGAELVLREEPITMPPDELPFGDKSRPSASIMRVAIQYRSQTIGILSVHSYTCQAYDRSDLATFQTCADYCAGALERIRVEEKVAVLNTQLLNAARHAGMEEVATSVLHNVGNVLNSVNVSATMVTENLSGSKLAGLQRVSRLLQTHASDLGRFLTLDPQGRQLPEYLETLATYWAAEQAGLLKELETLNRNILHIKNIIGRQQSFTGASGFAESVFVSDLLEDALTIAAADLERLDISLAREYKMHFPVVLDKMKLMLILVNLISNAREALLAATQPHKQLKLQTEIHRQDRLRIMVSDNGTGIAPENLTRIFSHGFTTKKTGHGFGLHGSALAAQELGGSLSVTSAGPGFGAEFILDLPLHGGQKTGVEP